jgi:hypothetical protein
MMAAVVVVAWHVDGGVDVGEECVSCRLGFGDW